MRFERVPIPTPRPTDVLVAVKLRRGAQLSRAIDLATRRGATGRRDLRRCRYSSEPEGTSPALLTMEEDRWRVGWDTKVFNYINLSREYFARMKARKSGAIVNLTGNGGIRLIRAISPVGPATPRSRLSPNRELEQS
jgi:hypothetical protein